MSIAHAISLLCEVGAQADIRDDFSIVLKFKNPYDRSKFKWALRKQFAPAPLVYVSSPNEIIVDGIKVSLE